MRRTLIRTVLGVVACAAFPASVPAQSTTSAAVAAELVQQLSKQNLTAVAAKVPDQPGLYVAAMYFPGMQLITVAARSTGPAYLDQQLEAKRYDEVYGSLNGASEPGGKLFVQDLHADGLKAAPEDGGGCDIAYENETKTVMLNGDWKKQKLTEAAYQQEYHQLDERYAKLLSLLLQQLQAGGQASPK
jgi:hypothetical protein